ncbi:hypothetical protein REPUB_Repub02eG0042700 [Reevesia pubescens]
MQNFDFKGDWHQNFYAFNTIDYDFNLENGSSVKTPFMTSGNRQLISAYDDAKDGLKDLVEKMSSESGFLKRHFPCEPVAVGDFRIPRFKISSKFKACEVVKGLGLVLPFSSDAGLTEIADLHEGENLFVSKIFHKSFVEVNEEGTEAAAAVFGLEGCAMFFEDKKDGLCGCSSISFHD